MLTSSPNHRQKGFHSSTNTQCVVVLHSYAVTTATPNQIHSPFNFFLSPSLPFTFWFHHWASTFTLSNINRIGVHLQPNLHKFILSGCPVAPMTLIRHPAHFSQLEIFEQNSVFVRQNRLELWFEVAGLIWDEGPDILGAAFFYCTAYNMSNAKMRLLRKVWPVGVPKINYLSVYTLSPWSKINKSYRSLS